MTMAAHNSALRLARISAVYERLTVTLSVTLVNAVLTAIVLAPQADPRRLVVWVGLIALLILARFIVRAQFFRAGEAARSKAIWERLSIAGSLLMGLLWGACSGVLMPADNPYPVFVAFVVAGMSAGSVTVNSSHPVTAIAFVVPATLPLAVWFMFQQTTLTSVMAGMTTIFAAAMVVASISHGRAFADGLRTSLTLARRTEELASTNAQLVAEIEKHRVTEAELRQSQKMEAVGGLTTGLAHDLNNLLMAISGAVELLQTQLASDQHAAPYLSTIFRATDRGGRLTRHLLAFARKDVLAPVVLDLNATVRHVASLLEATLGKAIRIECRLIDHLQPVYVDRNEIERAIVNLAINARDAMQEGGTLTFSTANVALPVAGSIAPFAHRMGVMLAVSDTGTGMSEAVRERAFDPFFTTKPPGYGSGLGLSQVYGFIEQSGGSARIDSEIGRGTTVSLLLPPAPDGTATAQEPSDWAAGSLLPAPPSGPAVNARDATGSPHHVVVLEDEAMVRDIVAQFLKGAGFRVSDFSVPSQALRCLQADPTVDALITDVGLPELSGEKVARIARTYRASLPVIFISGYNEAEGLTGEPWQLRKPFGQGELLAMLTDALAGVPERTSVEEPRRA